MVSDRRGILNEILFYNNKLTYTIVLLLVISGCNSGQDQVKNGIYEPANQPEFVGSETCISCHKNQYSSWDGSHHQQAMKIADSSSILGDFNDVIFINKNITSTFFKEHGEYFINTAGADGKYHDYKITYTFGVTPLQQYIVEFPNGQYQCLLTAWDTNQKKWFHLQPDLEIKHDEWINWTGGGMRWNTMCADCHSTDVNKNFNSGKDSYNTTYSEINVGCESCHGPASLHVGFYQSPQESPKPPKMYMDTTLSSKELVDKCARCHSRRAQITKVFDYVGSYLDHYNPSLLVYPLYEQDGQIIEEDYVYGSFIQSKMYHNDISCRDCHDVHSLELKKIGNDLCLSCHDPGYNEPLHHFHKINTEGSECISCHMTGKIYMGNDFRRDHSFRVPRPDQTVEYGTPNACNGCHKDKSPEWARDFVNSKYGPERNSHFSDYLLAGYNGDNGAYYHLMANGKYPEIVRATALNQYSNQSISPNELSAIKEFLKDSSALVRNEAVNTFDRSGNREFSRYIEPLLADSFRLVRISAARYFNTVNIVPENKLDFDKAQKEYLDDLEINADFASGQHQIALYHQAQNNIQSAIKAYKKAIKIDNYYNTSRMNLAFLLYTQGNVEGAEKLYLKVTEQEPEFGYSYYMLGLLYNEAGNPQKALKYLSKACEKEPVNIRAYYNYALVLQQTGQNEKSIEIIDRALRLIPDSEEFLYVKLIGQLNSNQYDAAYNSCNKLLEIAPNNDNYQQILGRLKQSKK